jgi:hypothetical protein
MDFAGAINIRGPLGNALGLSDFDADKMSLELGQIEQEIDGLELSADLGVSVTPRNIARLQGRLRKLKAKLKYAKTEGQKRRYGRRIERLEKKLGRAEDKVERRVERRQSKGKELTRRQKAALELLKSRKDKKEDRAKARAEAKGKVGIDAIKGVRHGRYVQYIRSLEPRIYATTRPLFAAGPMTGVAVARYDAAVSQVVSALPAPNAASKAGAIAHFRKNRTAYIGQWLKGAPGASAAFPAAAAAALPAVVAAGARPVLPGMPGMPAPVLPGVPGAIMQARLARRAALQAQLAQMQAQQQALAQQQAQAASAAQAQALAAQQAQYQQQLAAMRQQMAQFSAPSSPMYIPPQTSAFQPSQVSERGGAFQAFPNSTPLEQGPGPAAGPGYAPQGDEGAEGAEGAEDAEDAEGGEGAEGGEDAGAPEAGEDTPFYKKPIFFLLIAGAAAGYIYTKKKGKDGKDKKASGATSAA